MDIAAAQALLNRAASMTVFPHLREEQPARALRALLAECCRPQPSSEGFITKYCEVYEAFFACAAAGYNGFLGALLAQAAYTPCAFARLAVRLPYDQLPYSMVKAASHDLSVLGALAALEPAQIFSLAARANIPRERIDALPAWESTIPGSKVDGRLAPEMLRKEGLPLLYDFFRTQGIGVFAQYPGLCYVGEDAAHPEGLAGVESPDPIALSDLLHYEKQRQVLLENTECLLQGKQCANILLYGDKGTGKSASVKALLNAFGHRGLRVVEVSPASLCHLPRIFALLRAQPCKCIVFVDDLAFLDSSPEYTALKTVLEGGLEARPLNVAVYATSNRRNLVKQSFSEREDDVHTRDTLEEKFSLADRFDVRLTFHAPSQPEYLEMVQTMAARQGLAMPPATLREEALQWSLRKASTSPRTARQFVDAMARK